MNAVEKSISKRLMRLSNEKKIYKLELEGTGPFSPTIRQSLHFIALPTVPQSITAAKKSNMNHMAIVLKIIKDSKAKLELNRTMKISTNIDSQLMNFTVKLTTFSVNV